MLSARKISALNYIKSARSEAEGGNILKCIEGYTKGFYLRCTEEDFFDIEFSSFFFYQFKVFLLGKGTFSLSINEGDEVAKLICDTYEAMRISLDNSPFDISDEREWNILKTIEINFREKKTPFLTA